MASRTTLEIPERDLDEEDWEDDGFGAEEDDLDLDEFDDIDEEDEEDI